MEDTAFRIPRRDLLAMGGALVDADIPHQEVIFRDEIVPTMSPLQAKGVGELGLRGVAAAIANAVDDATGIRVRDYPITLDKFLDRLPVTT